MSVEFTTLDGHRKRPGGGGTAGKYFDVAVKLKHDGDVTIVYTGTDCGANFTSYMNTVHQSMSRKYDISCKTVPSLDGNDRECFTLYLPANKEEVFKRLGKSIINDKVYSDGTADTPAKKDKRRDRKKREYAARTKK